MKNNVKDRFPTALSAILMGFAVLATCDQATVAQDNSESQENGTTATTDDAATADPGSKCAVETLSGVVELDASEAASISLSTSADGKPGLKVRDAILASADILFITRPTASTAGAPDRAPVRIRLREHGDVLWAHIDPPETATEDDTVRVASFALASETSNRGHASVPIGAMAVVSFSEAFRDLLVLRSLESKLLSIEAADDDVLHLAKGDPIRGYLEEFTTGEVVFGADKLGRLELPFRKVRAIRVAEVGEDGEDDKDDEPKKEALSKEKLESLALVRAYLRDGSRLTGRLEAWDAKTIGIVHGGLGPLSIRLSEVTQIGFLGGRCQFLSDLEPASVRENLGPLFVAKLPYRRDANVLGGPLRMGDRRFPKGLGVHAYSRLEFDLSMGFERFQATIGLDEIARPRGVRGARKAAGSVVFRVFVDGKRLLEESMSFDTPAKSIDVDVTDGKSLVLEVDFEKKGLQVALDRANWCSARLIKKQ